MSKRKTTMSRKVLDQAIENLRVASRVNRSENDELAPFVFIIDMDGSLTAFDWAPVVNKQCSGSQAQAQIREIADIGSAYAMVTIVDAVYRSVDSTTGERGDPQDALLVVVETEQGVKTAPDPYTETTAGILWHTSELPPLFAIDPLHGACAATLWDHDAPPLN